MTIQQMQYYEAVCRHQNITRAASEIHIAQPTLSLAMQNLEKELGLNLFRHVGRSIEVTREGHALYLRVTRMLQHVEHFDESLRELRRERRRVRLALPMQCGTLLLPKLLGEFRAAHPDIELEISETTGPAALELVKNEDVDLAIVHDGTEEPSFTVRRLKDWPICLCVPDDHPLAAKENVTLAEIAPLTLAVLSPKYFTTRTFLARCQDAKLTPNVLHYTPYLSTIWNLVRARVACGIITENGLLPASDLRAIPIENLKQTEKIFLKKGRQIYDDQRTLMQYLKEACQ